MGDYNEQEACRSNRVGAARSREDASYHVARAFSCVGEQDSPRSDRSTGTVSPDHLLSSEHRNSTSLYGTGRAQGLTSSGSGVSTR